MSYSTLEAALSKTPFSLWIMTMDWCALSFGVAPCTATGTPCYNTWPTCKAKAAFSKTTRDYTFTSVSCPLPFPGPRPYVTGEKQLPTEIKDSLTVSARIGVDMADEPDTDVDMDPYYASRASIQGTFWKKFVARNPWKGRTIKRYQGYAGLTEAEVMAGGPRFDGVIDNITFGDKGSLTIEAKDRLGALADVEIPEKLNVKLAAPATALQDTLSLDGDYDELPAADLYLRLGDEIILGAVRTGNQVTGCTRGYFNTAAAEYGQNAKVQLCRYYGPQSGYDILSAMLLTDAGIASGLVDSPAFAAWKAFDSDMPCMSALISEPTNLKDLYFEIVELLDCKSWVNEDLKITIAKNLPNFPGRVYRTFIDGDNIIKGSQKVDLNDKSRFDTIALYWDKDMIGDADKPASYGRCDIFTALDTNLYPEASTKTVWCRWLRHDYMDEDKVIRFIRCIGKRMLRLSKNPMPILSFAAGLIDSGVRTGEYVGISTPAIQNPDGSDISSAVFQIVRRQQEKNVINLQALRYPGTRVCFIQDNTGAADYTAATAARKEYGFISGLGGLMSDNSPGYNIY